MRVVSLLASATEIVYALGAGDSLVGRSHECDNPPCVRSLPPCSEPAFDISVSSRDIDTEVNRRIRSGEPLYRIDRGLIRADQAGFGDCTGALQRVRRYAGRSEILHGIIFGMPAESVYWCWMHQIGRHQPVIGAGQAL